MLSSDDPQARAWLAIVEAEREPADRLVETTFLSRRLVPAGLIVILGLTAGTIGLIGGGLTTLGASLWRRRRF